MNKLNSILLIDDNKIDNFFHERVIKKYDAAIRVTAKTSGEQALDYLLNATIDELPDLIFLDINMPGMNGWEFLQEYHKMGTERKKSMIIVMLSTSEDPEDKAMALTQGIAADYKSKPLTQQMLEEIMQKH